jgi:hypothetical protein
MAPLQHEDNFNMAPSHRQQQIWPCKTAASPLHRHKRFYEDITVLPALRKSTFECQDSALQKIFGQTALPAFHKIVYANFRLELRSFSKCETRISIGFLTHL